LSTHSLNKGYWVGFSRIPRVGRVRLGRLEKYFGSLEDAWKAPESELINSGMDETTVRAITGRRSRIDIDREMEYLSRNNIGVLTYHDPEYPVRLKQISDFPPVLFVKGALPYRDEPVLAVVGTRLPSNYGKEVTRDLTRGAVKNGLVVVSGLARGVDSIAHQATIEAEGRTVAVCATGLDHVYPPSNHKLAQKILEKGAVISEYPPGTLARPEYFPRRNRIMAGLAMGILVTEARKESGALITAKIGVDCNREVFAVPGSIYSLNSQGANQLIGEGAKLVTGVDDILEELNLPALNSQQHLEFVLPENSPEARIARVLTREPHHIDSIVRLTGLATALVSSALTVMELKGIVKQTGVMTYTLIQPAHTGKEYDQH